MAIELIGTGTVDFDTRDELILPAIEMDVNDGHIFLLSTSPAAISTVAGYLNIYFLLEDDGLEYQTPLWLRWFPSGRTTISYFGIPRSFFQNNTEVRMLLQPKEFSPGLEQNRQFDIIVSWDDGGRADASVVAWPTA